jgi:outer membrane protein OmpA-like peptidoglycan-associated protein
MAFNLTDFVKSLVTPELLSTASTFLGEDSQGISKAIDAAIPTLLSSVVNKAAVDGSTVFSIARQTASGGVLENLSALFGGNANLLSMGSGLISGLLGNNTGVVSSMISSYAGIKPSSATTLMSEVAPLVLGALGKHVLSNGLDAAGLGSLLSSQKDLISISIPSGLNVSGLITIPAEQSLLPVQTEENKMGMPVWALPLLLVVSGALLIWYFIGGKKENVSDLSTTKYSAREVPAAKQMLKVELPGGVILDAYRGGIEDQLVNFLKDPSSEAGKDVWFDFDNLNFATGTADINAESQVQINNIASILRAFPKAKIKIGGYTDKTGDESANLTLSRSRAETVKAALTAAGVGAQVTEAEGYGSQYAKLPVEAPETSRVIDRRVSVSVREK